MNLLFLWLMGRAKRGREADMSDDQPDILADEPDGIVMASIVPRSAAELSSRAQSPPRWSEVLAALTLVVLADVTLYRGHGFAGISAMLFVGALLLWLGAWRPRWGADFWLLAGLLTVLSARLLWQGSWLAVGVGCGLLLAYAMALSGQRPYVLAVVAFVSQVIRGGFDGLLFYAQRLTGRRIGPVPRWLNVVLPALALIVFAAIFTAANPDVLKLVSETAEQWALSVQTWLANFSIMELLFWLVVLWLATGLLRPTLDRGAATEHSAAPRLPVTAEPAPLYIPFRNTLCAVIGLFALYLVFEFSTLWFREFPQGFYYAGYAHNGAAWLTLALALATATLSLIFSGRILRDPRLATLRRLAWAWSLLNFLLALAVYHRLLIYIGFNGLTRLRIVGLLGITAVVIGFLLVLWKITRDRSFAWLVRRQLWTVALMVYLYAILPVDAMVVHYNVARIIAGDPKPAVQFAVQPISTEGLFMLDPLLASQELADKHPLIRQGAQVLLARAEQQANATVARQQQLGWTAWQMADEMLAARLAARCGNWAEYADEAKRAEVFAQFKKYVHPWY